jgi:hypothetical protein
MFVQSCVPVTVAFERIVGPMKVRSRVQKLIPSRAFPFTSAVRNQALT